MHPTKKATAVALLFGLHVSAFQAFNNPCPGGRPLELSMSNRDSCHDTTTMGHLSSNRREFFQVLVSSFAAAGMVAGVPGMAVAAVGSLPEFRETNAILQGITVNVADKSQQDAMIDFLVNGFNFKILRKRINDPVEDTVSRKRRRRKKCMYLEKPGSTHMAASD